MKMLEYILIMLNNIPCTCRNDRTRIESVDPNCPRCNYIDEAIVKDIKNHIAAFKDMQEKAYRSMGDTGSDKYQVSVNQENYWFGYYRALEDLDMIKKSKGR